MIPQEKRIIRSTPGPEGQGCRLDAWLAARFTYRSRSEWQQAVRSCGTRAAEPVGFSSCGVLA